MHIEWFGDIKISDCRFSGKTENEVIRDAIYNFLQEDDNDERYCEYIEGFDCDHGISTYGTGNYDDVEIISDILRDIFSQIIKLCPRCKIDACFCGTNMSTGDTMGFIERYSEFIGGRIDIDESCEITCPKCGAYMFKCDDVEFDKTYNCEYCDCIVTAEEIKDQIDEIPVYITEYNNDGSEKESEIESGTLEKAVAKFWGYELEGEKEETPICKISLSGAKVVTTGLSQADENKVKQLVESNGGEFKDNFVVSLTHLVYNPYYDHETTKLKKAKEQKNNGKNVTLLTFDEFMNLF